MSRSISVIQAEIEAAKNADANLAGLTSTSQTAIWRLWTFIVAASIHYHETLWDLFKVDLEAIAASARVGSSAWLHDQVLRFQYDALEPQIVQVVDFVATYNPIDVSKRIVSRAAVKQQTNRRVVVKAAKDDGSGGLESLATDELSALRSYIKQIQFAGTSIGVTSLEADRIKATLEVRYDGQYVQSTVIQAVKDAINGYLSNLDFDGVIVKNRLIDAVQVVDGVVDLKLTELIGRQEVELITSSGVTTIYSLSGGIDQSQYEASAGYAVSEDTPGHTLDDTITMVLA
jgi:hypothetical protein